MVYAAFAARASRSGPAPLAAVLAAVGVGLVLTMARIALARQRLVLPALPLAVALASSLLGMERLLVRTLAEALANASVVM